MTFRRVTIERPIWVKGKGLPKDGVCLFSEGDRVTAVRKGGVWFLQGHYRGMLVEVATILAD